jgi:hypothetical protein
MVGRTFSQIGIYKINDNSEIISATKTIEKLPENALAYNERIGDSPVYRYEHLDKKVLNKINELVDAVNKLNGERYE